MYKLLLGLNLIISPTIHAIEQILDLHSQIKVNHDCSLSINETIQVQVEHHQIKHGITRTIPVNYQNKWGLRHSTQIRVKQILLDGLPVPYSSQTIGDSLFIKIGFPDKLISLGEHIYQISYDVDRLLIFEPQLAELYYNVVGNDVGFSVLQARASINLPQTIPDHTIKLIAYTGPVGAQKTNFHSWIDQDGTIQFQTTQRLKPYEAFTISTAFPKEILSTPTNLALTSWFVRDNYLMLILIVSFILLLITATKFFWQHNQNKAVITPLFYPPQDLLPWQVGYLYHLENHANIFTATLVDLAVKGYLTIQPQKTAAFDWLKRGNRPGSTSYELVKSEQSATDPNSFYDKLVNLLFSDQAHGNSNRLVLERNNSKIKSFEGKLATNPYLKDFKWIADSLVLGLAIFNIMLSAIIIHLNDSWMITLPAIIVSSTILICMLILYAKYTGEAGKLEEEVLGFRMYLATAEKKRLETLNPPTKTITLYEKYLPYAIALDVDQQWSEAFAQIFAQMGAYQPSWYGRSRFYSQNIKHFHSDLNSLASKRYPASNSGQNSHRGGSGYSGGGRGGGGIGGW